MSASAIGRISQDELESIRIRDFLAIVFADEMYGIDKCNYERLLEGIHDIVNFLVTFCENALALMKDWVIVRLMACSIKDGHLNNMKQINKFYFLCPNVKIVEVNFESCTFEVLFLKTFDKFIQKEYYPFVYDDSNWKHLERFVK